MENIKNAIQATLEATEGGEWTVHNEEGREVDIEVSIKDSLFAFNSDFLAEVTELPEEVFKGLQPQYEASNEAIEKLIEATCGMDTFIEEATRLDGYGHFLSPYDGEEIEIEVEGECYFAYRQN